MSNTMTFIDACLHGYAQVHDVDDWVDHWHETGGAPEGEALSLPNYIGLSPTEYEQWVKDDDFLRTVIVQRADQTPRARYVGDASWFDRPVATSFPASAH